MEEETGGSKRRAGLGDNIRTGIGVLNALKDAIEETLEEAVERGDLSTERAREAMRGAMHRAQESVEEARENFDLVPRKEFERLRAEVDGLRARLDRLERTPTASGPADSGGESDIIVDSG